MVQIKKKKNFSKTHTSNTESVNYHIDDSAWCFLCSPWLTANRVERLSNHTDKNYYGSTWLDWLMKHALYSLSTVQLFKAVLFTPSFIVPSSSNQRSVWTWTETKHRGSESITKVNVHDSCPWPLPSDDWWMNYRRSGWFHQITVKRIVSITQLRDCGPRQPSLVSQRHNNNKKKQFLLITFTIINNNNGRNDFKSIRKFDFFCRSGQNWFENNSSPVDYNGL